MEKKGCYVIKRKSTKIKHLACSTPDGSPVEYPAPDYYILGSKKKSVHFLMLNISKIR